MKQDPIVIVPYDSAWPALFSREKERLTQIFSGASATVEHVGGTAVPGLAGQPVIDILLGVVERRDVRSRLSALEGLGYGPANDLHQAMPGCRIFVKNPFRGAAYLLYTVEIGGEHWRHFLLVRDYLRAHQKLTDHFSELKRSLAGRFKDRPGAYREGKTDFIKQVQTEAEAGFCPFC